MANVIHLFVHDLHSTVSNEETFRRDFLAFASELLENREEMILRYYMHSDMFSMFKSLTT